MDVRLDILRRNHQAWLNSNDGRPSMVTESAPVLTSNVSLADTFFVLVHRQQVRVFSPPVCSRVLVLLTALLAMGYCIQSNIFFTVTIYTSGSVCK